jgi:hypothetical protein
MAQIYVKKTDNRGALIAVAGLLGLGGVVLVILGLKQGQSGVPGLCALLPGEQMSAPDSLIFHQQTPGGIEVSISAAPFIIIPHPVVYYAGPGRDAFTYAEVKQTQGNKYGTVYASGIAGTHLPNSATLAQFDCVPPTQPEPTGCPAQALCLSPWPGTTANPICGFSPIPGSADLYLSIYQNTQAVDGGGYASPTCNPSRCPVQRTVLKNAITFTP